ncbi:hypothetical protein AV530_018141 [Patagioenas fasciata monilis]|uniref:Uncharacterized protein n=1 Tax=Patagioenas fasciata monilis TaxID=372326 RepID=A0A1V4KKY1_PATFA|nr:hypothetical protein AV530_018141 [Patagioenas fasciata monilis]
MKGREEAQSVKQSCSPESPRFEDACERGGGAGQREAKDGVPGAGSVANIGICQHLTTTHWNIMNLPESRPQSTSNSAF